MSFFGAASASIPASSNPSRSGSPRAGNSNGTMRKDGNVAIRLGANQRSLARSGDPVEGSQPWQPGR